VEVVTAKKATRAMSAGRMVENSLRSRGIRDARVLAAMSKVRREEFVPLALRERAYSDHPLPIGFDQTISQPFVVALMTEYLKLTGAEKVLEVGTGSGYQTAILAELAKSVFSVERIRNLATDARRRLEAMGYHNISIRASNGVLGWSEYAPYDHILVTAAVHELPKSLREQVKEGGIILAPLGQADSTQKLFAFRKCRNKWIEEYLAPCAFVPFIS
jgi:protein-L-isoaspartate(D-aspartate) O-methyltransferase